MVKLKIEGNLLGFEHNGMFISDPNQEYGDPKKVFGLTKAQIDMIENFNKTHDLTCYCEHTEPQIF